VTRRARHSSYATVPAQLDSKPARQRIAQSISWLAATPHSRVTIPTPSVG
jgi:hypothetical protein